MWVYGSTQQVKMNASVSVVIEDKDEEKAQVRTNWHYIATFPGVCLSVCLSICLCVCVLLI